MITDTPGTHKTRRLAWFLTALVFAVVTAFVLVAQQRRAEVPQRDVILRDLIDADGHADRTLTVRTGLHLLALPAEPQPWYPVAADDLTCAMLPSGVMREEDVGTGYAGYAVYRYVASGTAPRPRAGSDECATGTVVMLPEQFADDSRIVDHDERQRRVLVAAQMLYRGMREQAAVHLP